MRFENVCMHQESTDICLKKKKHIFQFAIASTEIYRRYGVLDTSSASLFFLKCYLQQIVVTQSIVAATRFISFEYIPITQLSYPKFNSEQTNHNVSLKHWILHSSVLKVTPILILVLYFNKYASQINTPLTIRISDWRFLLILWRIYIHPTFMCRNRIE